MVVIPPTSSEVSLTQKGYPGIYSMQVLAEGVKKASSLDATQVANAIGSLAGIETPMGKLTYTADGDLREQTIYIFQMQGGDWVHVYPTP